MKINQLLLFVWAILSFASVGANAQERKVVGSVKDETGGPLPGVYVTVKDDPTVGTVTDVDGNYEISVSSGTTLRFSFLGFKTQEVLVGERSVINISLENDVTELNEIVITALGGSKSAKSLTYSVQKVLPKDLTVARDANVVANLQGNVAGLQVSPAATGLGGSMRLVLRGNRSLLGNNQPLIVYNGIVINSTPIATASADGSTDLGSPLEDINAADVQEVSVLKGGNSSALYGSLGYNGALEMVGNKGTRKNGLGITLSTNTYAQIPVNLFKTQTEYGQGRYDATTRQYTYTDEAAGSWGPRFGTLNPVKSFYDENQTTPYRDMGNALQKYYQVGVVTLNNVSIEKAADDYSIRFSYGNTYNKYVLPGSKLDKNQFSISGTYKLNNWIKGESFVAYTRQETVNRNVGTEGQSNVLRYFALAPRSYSVEDLSSHYLDPTGVSGIGYTATPNVNPYFIANIIINQDTRDRFMASQQLEIKFHPNLKFKGVGGTDYLAMRVQDNYAPKTFSPYPDGSINIRQINNWSYNLMGLMEYNNQFGHFELNAQAGWMRYVATSLYTQFQGVGFASLQSPLLYSTGNSSKVIFRENTRSKNILTSAFANVDFSYKSWIFLNATVRTDLTSSINKNYTYPSVSFSILPSEISERLKFSVFDYWKLRGSFALLNNGGVPYQTRNTTYVTPGPYLNGVTIARYGGSAGDEYPSIAYKNPNLKPESTLFYEGGLDISMLSRRIFVSTSYFLMQSRDQIFDLEGSYSTGYVSRVVNSGQINNSGVEVELKTTPVKRRDFSWDFNVNYTYYRSRIVSLANGIDRIKVDGSYNAAVSSYNIVGLPYGQLYGTDYLRNPEGKIYYDQTSGLPVQNPNLTSLGSSTPDFLMGIRNTFAYKGLALSVLLDWKQGGKLYSYTNALMTSAGNTQETIKGRDAYVENQGMAELRDYQNGILIDSQQEKLADLANGGSPAMVGTIGSDIALRGVEPSLYWSNYAGFTKNFTYDASFMKIREVSLIYTFNAEKIKKSTKGVIQGFNVGYVGRNVLTVFKHTPNIDPESSFTSGNGQGVEYHSLPIFATHGIKLTIDF